MGCGVASRLGLATAEEAVVMLQPTGREERMRWPSVAPYFPCRGYGCEGAEQEGVTIDCLLNVARESENLTPGRCG